MLQTASRCRIVAKWLDVGKIATPASQEWAGQVKLCSGFVCQTSALKERNIARRRPICTQQPTEGTWRTWQHDSHGVLIVLHGAFGPSADLDMSYWL